MSLIGQYASLEVVNTTSFGFYLDAGELGEVLMPKKLADITPEEGDIVEVFVYLDSEDRPIATTNKPLLTVDQVANLTVSDVGRFGAFLDWGLEKDVLLPFAEQSRPLEQGDRCLVFLYLDKVDHRITASSKLDKFIEEDGKGVFKPRQKVSITIAAKTDLGFKAVINNTHWGLIFHADVFDKLSIGQKTTAYIKQIRPDGKINLSLDGGKESKDKNAELIIKYLKENNGFAPFHDKTDAKLISRVFGISKGAFKKAIGGLYKSGDIVIENGKGIKLTK